MTEEKKQMHLDHDSNLPTYLQRLIYFPLSHNYLLLTKDQLNCSRKKKKVFLCPEI